MVFFSNAGKGRGRLKHKIYNFFRKVKEKPKEVSAAGETPDLVRDCNEVALAEEILAE